MADSRLRVLQRRWLENNASEDEAAYLLERVRIGDLTAERLDLAAYSGCAGATRLAPVPGQTPTELGPWLTGTKRFGSDAFFCAGLAIAKGALPCDPNPRYTELVEKAEAYLRCPCASHRSSIMDAQRYGHKLTDLVALALADASNAERILAQAKVALAAWALSSATPLSPFSDESRWT